MSLGCGIAGLINSGRLVTLIDGLMYFQMPVAFTLFLIILIQISQLLGVLSPMKCFCDNMAAVHAIFGVHGVLFEF